MTLYYKRKSRHIAKQIAEEFIVIDPEQEKYLVLNQTGAVIYRFLKKKRTLTEIITRMTSLYEVPPDKLKKHVSSFLEKCIREEYLIIDHS